jgi:hypothetical protein
MLEHEAGLTWTVDEAGERSSHALVDGGRVWLVDPVDEPEAIERATALGEPAAVLQLLDRHNRDGAALASRLGIPHVRLPRELPDAPLEPFSIVSVPGWREVGLWWEARRTLVVPEAVGTGAFFTLGGGAAGVHLVLALLPPRGLRRYAPEHLLVGHGPSLHGEQATAALHDALARSRTELPRALLRLPRLLR